MFVLEQLSKIKFWFIIGENIVSHIHQIGQINKQTATSQTKKEKRRNILSLAFLTISYKPATIVQLSTYTRKVTGMLGIRFVAVVVFVGGFFFTMFFFTPLRL